MIVDQKISKKIVGVFLLDKEIDGSKLALTKEPSKLNKFFIRLFFGWKWIPIKNIKKK